MTLEGEQVTHFGGCAGDGEEWSRGIGICCAGSLGLKKRRGRWRFGAAWRWCGWSLRLPGGWR